MPRGKLNKYTDKEREELEAVQAQYGQGLVPKRTREDIAARFGRTLAQVSMKLLEIRTKKHGHLSRPYRVGLEDRNNKELVVHLMPGKIVWADMNPDGSGIMHMSFRRLEVRDGSIYVDA